MAEIIAKKYPNVTASILQRLTVDFAKANDANFILRGLRGIHQILIMRLSLP